MKWSTAVQHVAALAAACAERAVAPPIIPLRVTQLWAAGDILGPPRDLDVVTVALCVDLPVADVPWWSIPPAGEAWANSTRLSKNPILPWWRSAHAPVWNHRIVRPLLVWDQRTGVDEGSLTALREGRGLAAGLPEPTAAQLADRLRDELTLSLAALQARTREYDERRWSPGRLESIADPLHRAADGYLDVLDALSTERGTGR